MCLLKVRYRIYSTSASSKRVDSQHLVWSFPSSMLLAFRMAPTVDSLPMLTGRRLLNNVTMHKHAVRRLQAQSSVKNTGWSLFTQLFQCDSTRQKGLSYFKVWLGEMPPLKKYICICLTTGCTEAIMLYLLILWCGCGLSKQRRVSSRRCNKMTFLADCSVL